MKAPILSREFKWIPAQSHTDPALFAARQRARMVAAQSAKVTPFKRKESKS